jgi:ribonuclease PH
VTAEYAMLPGSTTERKRRGVDGRATEIGRLIGRALRAVVDRTKLGPHTVTIDCDVLQADGGTRTAAINGGYVALVDALERMRREGVIDASPITAALAAVSVGVVDGRVVLDLDYTLDVRAEVDMNVVMTSEGAFVEVQGTAESGTFDEETLTRMLTLARRGIRTLLKTQEQALTETGCEPGANP